MLKKQPKTVTKKTKVKVEPKSKKVKSVSSKESKVKSKVKTNPNKPKGKKPTQNKNGRTVVRASGASTWVNCPGSTHIKTSKYPYNNNDQGIFGNAVHNAAACILQGQPVELSTIEELHKNERLEDFENYLNFYLDTLHDFAWREGEFIVEQAFKSTFNYHVISGHNDYAVLQIDGLKVRLQVIDLKTGYIPVDVYDNLQLFCYAHLILNDILPKRFNKKELVEVIRDIEIEAIIVQPAHNVVKFTNIIYSPLRFASLYDPEDKTLKTGSWCKYCEATDFCPEFKKVYNLYYKPDLQGVTLDRVDLISEVLPLAAVVQKVAERVQKDAKAILLDGGKIDGWKLGKKGGPRSFLKSFSPEVLLKKLKLKKSDLYELKIKTPAKIEAAHKGIKLNEFVFKPMNDVLIPDDNIFEKK